MNHVDPAALIAALATRRWFGAKGRSIADAALEHATPLADGALACVRVRFADGDGDEALYNTPLAADATNDALANPAFRQQLGQAFSAQSTLGDWRFEALAPLADLGALPSRLLDGEQSNTSIVFGERAILKMFRRLEPGPQPDVEIGRFLTTRTEFRGTPALLGVLHLETGAGPCVAGMVQEFMPGAVDGWTHVLDRLGARDDTLTTELHALGAATRALHTALASDPHDPAFAPEPTTEHDLGRWRLAAETRIHDALTRLAAQQASLPTAVAAIADQVLARRDELVAHVRVAIDVAAAGPRIRHHGDYHLGQVLRTPDVEWRIIDFEGEPARPLAERRAKHHPLRDVAGMLRSFAYAAAVVAPQPRGAEQAMRAAFLEGYDPTLADDPRRAGLLTLFSAEKLFYELTYELGSRPDWAWIPLAGISTLLLPVSS